MGARVGSGSSPFRKATNTEVVNKPNSGWLASFAKTANHVFKALDPLKEAYKVSGNLGKIRDGNLVFLTPGEWGRNEIEIEIPPAFQLSEGFLEDWLDQDATALVINGYAVKIWRTTRYEKFEYPEPVESGLPFE